MRGSIVGETPRTETQEVRNHFSKRKSRKRIITSGSGGIGSAQLLPEYEEQESIKEGTLSSCMILFVVSITFSCHSIRSTYAEAIFS
jgi:hypothetical protein